MPTRSSRQQALPVCGTKTTYGAQHSTKQAALPCQTASFDQKSLVTRQHPNALVNDIHPPRRMAKHARQKDVRNSKRRAGASARFLFTRSGLTNDLRRTWHVVNQSI